MVYRQLLVDELELLINAHQQVIVALEKRLRGEAFDDYNPNADLDYIYEYCLHFFTRSDCPLGEATLELSEWISTHADRQKAMKRGFDALFQGFEMNFNPSERFKSETESYLRDIEHSNALEAFNQLMQQVRELLENRSSIEDILAVVKRAQN